MPKTRNDRMYMSYIGQGLVNSIVRNNMLAPVRRYWVKVNSLSAIIT